MSTTVKTGWLNDKNGDKFAPKTLISQVQTSDGISLEDKIQTDLDATKTEILNSVSIDVDSELSSTSTNPIQNKVIDAEFEAVSTAMNALETSIDGKADASHSHDDLYYTETEIDTFLASKASSAHTHAIADVSNLQSSLDEKSNIGHTHTVENITDLTATATELNYMSGVTSNVQTQLDDKSNIGHTHAISDVTNLQSSLDSKVPITRTINSKELNENIVLSASDVGADASGSADAALSSAQTYTDNAVSQKTQVQIITWEDSD